MAEGVIDQIKDAPKTALKMPWMALTIGLIFMVIVLLVESFKPGLLTGPIRRGLAVIGVKGAA